MPTLLPIREARDPLVQASVCYSSSPLRGLAVPASALAGMCGGIHAGPGHRVRHGTGCAEQLFDSTRRSASSAKSALVAFCSAGFRVSSSCPLGSRLPVSIWATSSGFAAASHAQVGAAERVLATPANHSLRQAPRGLANLGRVSATIPTATTRPRQDLQHGWLIEPIGPRRVVVGRSDGTRPARSKRPVLGGRGSVEVTEDTSHADDHVGLVRGGRQSAP